VKRDLYAEVSTRIIAELERRGMAKNTTTSKDQGRAFAAKLFSLESRTTFSEVSNHPITVPFMTIVGTVCVTFPGQR
jgi:hypothetical protein